LNGRKHGKDCWALIERTKHPSKGFQFWNVKQLADHEVDLPSLAEGQKRVHGYLCINNQNIENKHDERFFFQDGGLEKVLPLEQPGSTKIKEAYSALIRDYQSRHAEHVKERQNPDRRQGEHPAYSRFILDSAAATLKKGDLVYALVEDDTVKFIAPVAVPRRAYEHRIAELLRDPQLKTCEDSAKLCPACRVFGWVHVEKSDATTAAEPTKASNQPRDATLKPAARAGRVFFSHGKLTYDAGHLPSTPLAILSSPKPTTTRFYLEPEDGSDPEKWAATDGYDDSAVLRGRKFYRHHGAAREAEYVRVQGKCDDQNRTVRDARLPGTSFEFTIRFENLAPLELGALLWAIEMEDHGVHRLGFAKPLGFGSVKVRIKDKGLQTMDPAVRYRSLEDSGWQPVEEWGTLYVERFKKAIADRYQKGFEELPQVEDLRAILSDPPLQLPVHYPRSSEKPSAEGKNFEWFLGNNRRTRYKLRRPAQDAGLPLIDRTGAEL
jgi:CRISPR-associated protein (TIGR03986 family)